jgi:peptide-methionine (R)-S-oxide reductase
MTFYFSSQKKMAFILIGTGLIIILYFLLQNYMDMNNQNPQAMKNDDLTEEQRYILEEKGTEVPFTSELLKEKRPGTYYAADTKEPVFRSEDKFDSGTGWPSFTKPINPEAVEENTDESHGMTRTEVTSTEGGHLGHVFTDGPADKGGLRYCINGDALYFVPDNPEE